VAGGRQRQPVAGRERLGPARKLVDDAVGRAAGIDRDRALFAAETALNVERLPVAALFELGETERVLARLAKAARSTSPGRPPPTFRTTSWTARPIVAFARLPWPSTFIR